MPRLTDHHGLENDTPVVVVHGGAGGHTDEIREREAEYRAALEEALNAAADALAGAGGARGGAVEAVRAAVMVLESVPLFNAGHGAALCSDGSVELSASVMRGSDRAAGGVAMITRTRHPVAAAVALLDEPEVLLAGANADAQAAANGLEQIDQTGFVTERQRRRLAEGRAGGAVGPDPETVGAVCLDATGLLAAATSTGGLNGQRPGRIGDSPLIGAGTWADERVAVSCTGQGETFIRAGAARLVAALLEQGETLESAADAAMEAVAGCGGTGGLIAVDAHGNVTAPRSTAAMPCGVWRGGKIPVTTVP
ncbi:MAG TPA: isoaspartyl peptidase/L-asparaginase [Solirubrobacteraceae bacterium]|nr:isoaspartyl peptidase/L-asparaginase [Solirubrobacteraceae bacterium]